MKTHGPIVQQLRRIVRDAESRGITQYRLALLAGIDKAQFTRLMHGTVDPRVQTADKIAHAAGYEFRAVKVRKPRKR